MLRKIFYICIFIWVVGETTQAIAQVSNRRCVTFPAGEQTFLKDSLLIDPLSIELVPAVGFDFDGYTSEVILQEPISDSLEVCYRVLPLNLEKIYYHKSSDLYDSSAAFRPAFLETKLGLEKEELFSTPNIYKTGSLTRGISFGNSQSAAVTSSFNFQLDGKLTDNLSMRADITDQNVPFQPEGNTQQLREFDNVTFEIYNDNLSLLAGDVLLKNKPSNFMRFYKNALGGQVDVKYSIDSMAEGRSTVAIAAAKGQFVDITLDAVEGLQGPYQLHGPSGQRFVIVMANSENIYLDGRLLKRGYNYDYTIDYNLGELTFNPNILITQFSRIRVTFEYSDQNYSRSIVNAQQEITMGKVTMDFGYYREKDNRNKPLAFLLSDQDKLQMSLAGDDNLPVPIGSEIQSAYNPDQVLYTRKDTLDLDGNLQSVFEYSRDSTVSLYQVSFTNVGLGQGDYRLVENDVNGRVYEWVSPELGQNIGEHAAVKFVPAPSMKQMATLGARVVLTDKLSVFSELALSNHDLNLYSDLGNEDNKDFAHKTGIVLERLPLDFISGYFLSANVDYEHDGKNFRPIDRYRAIEFDRNWSYNVQTDTFKTADNIFQSGFLIQKDAKNLLSAKYSLRQKENAIAGFQQDLVVKKNFGSLNLSGGYFDMQNENLIESSSWNRWHGEAFFDKIFVVPGYRIETDNNRVKAVSLDSLTRTAMNYTSQQFYLRSNDTLKTHFKLDYTLREDKSVLEGRLVPFSLSKTTSANLTTPQTGAHFLNLTMTYRELAYQADFSELEDESLILGRVNWRGAYLDRHIDTDLTYATSSSREILREFIYVQVTAGEGTHTWRDLNDDGVQDITEFFEAINFDERNYIKVFVPTAEFVGAFNTIFTFTLNANMPRAWKGQGGLKEVLGKLSTRTNVNINKKNTNDNFASRFNPFALDTDSKDLIFTRDGIRSTLFYNRSGRGLGADFSYAINHSKQLISRGVDARDSEDLIFNFRYHVSSEFSMVLSANKKEKRNASEFQENRNYLIRSDEISPGLIWQPTNNLRVSTIYSLTRKKNVESEVGESSHINEIKMDTRWSNGIKNSLNVNFALTKIEFEGDASTASAYELLNALQPGNNVSWQISYNQKLVSGLQVNVGYEGRKSQERSTIHMGRVQVTALF